MVQIQNITAKGTIVKIESRSIKTKVTVDCSFSNASVGDTIVLDLYGFSLGDSGKINASDGSELGSFKTVYSEEFEDLGRKDLNSTPITRKGQVTITFSNSYDTGSFRIDGAEYLIEVSPANINYNLHLYVKHDQTTLYQETINIPKYTVLPLFPFEFRIDAHYRFFNGTLESKLLILFAGRDEKEVPAGTRFKIKRTNVDNFYFPIIEPGKRLDFLADDVYKEEGPFSVGGVYQLGGTAKIKGIVVESTKDYILIELEDGIPPKRQIYMGMPSHFTEDSLKQVWDEGAKWKEGLGRSERISPKGEVTEHPTVFRQEVLKRGASGDGDYNPQTTLTIKYVDTTGKSIYTDTVVKRQKGDKYAITKPDIKGFKYKSMTPTETTSHTFGDTDTTYTLVYDVVAKTRLVVKFEDTKGAKIKEPVTTEAYPGEPYTVSTNQSIPNYTYQSVKGQTQGTYPETGETVVTLIYRLKEVGKVTVYHKDVETNEDIVPPVILSGNAGEAWLATKMSFKQYNFERVDGFTNGVFGESSATVTYYYKKVKVNPAPLPTPGGSSGCIDCKCKQIPHDDDLCKNLHQLNDNATRGASRILKDARLCDIPELLAKVLYNIWCLFKNLIAVICSTLDKLDQIKKKLNEVIKKLNALCEAVKCLAEQIQKQGEEKLKKYLENISFALTGGGTDLGVTYTNVNYSPDGTFSFSWNMADVEGGVGEIGTGVVRGKVNASYTPNDDGSIQANVAGVKLDSIVYTATGATPTTSLPGTFTIQDKSGNTVFTKTYQTNSSWSETLNKTLTYNETVKLAPGKGTGNIFVLKTLDTWVNNPTEGNLYASYTNNNTEAVQQVNTSACNISCEPISTI